jgi:hypothetical protein
MGVAVCRGGQYHHVADCHVDELVRKTMMAEGRDRRRFLRVSRPSGHLDIDANDPKQKVGRVYASSSVVRPYQPIRE